MQTFMGIKVFQTWADLGIWEEFFNTYPIRTFIEFGSGYGGSTLFFALQCHQRGIQFHTYDNQRNFNVDAGLHGLLGTKNTFHNINIFGEAAGESQSIGAIIDTCTKPLAIFFDDGDKPREWKVYAPRTSPGDFCIVHDWGKEFKESDIGGVKVEQIMVKQCESRPPTDWKAMWFVRV
jgi:hypothetical protein